MLSNVPLEFPALKATLGAVASSLVLQLQGCEKLDLDLLQHRMDLVHGRVDVVAAHIQALRDELEEPLGGDLNLP